MGTLQDDLRRASAYPDAPSEEVRLIETHISWVFLRHSEVFKVKKPLDLGFLDFRAIEQRRAACEAEVLLNRRLAPDVYLGTLPVRRREDGTHTLGNEGEIVDWAVHMVRLPDEERGDVLLAENRIDAEGIRRIAETIADFHARARCDEHTASFGLPEIIERSVRENFDQTRAIVDRYITREQFEEIEGWQTSFLRDRAELFRHRATTGRVRDGHGDLRLEHCYFREDGSLTIIDCIEFNERFRYADVCADLAFLTMDLEFCGRADLAQLLLAAYASESGDFELYGLVGFYESYRAYVRAKVSALLADDEGAAPAVRERAADHARRYFLLALAATRKPPTQPVVIAVGGIIASGKSTVAEQVGRLLGAPVVEADRTRKQMLGVAPRQAMDEPIWQGAYAPAFTDEVYAEVLRRASFVLASGRAVVLDASFRSATMRKRARELAEAHGVPFLFVECRAPRELCRERLARRERERGISDGRLAIFDDFCARWEPVTEIEEGMHLVLDTTRPLAESLHAVEEKLAPGPQPEG